MINELPTVYEEVIGAVKQLKDQAIEQNNNSKKKSGGRIVSMVCVHFTIFSPFFLSPFSVFHFCLFSLVAISTARVTAQRSSDICNKE